MGFRSPLAGKGFAALTHHTWVLYQKDPAVSRHTCNRNCVGTTGRKSNLNLNPTRQPVNLAYVLSSLLSCQEKGLELV